MCLMLFSKACGFVKDVNWRKFRVTFWEGGGACGPCMLLCRAYWGNFGYGRIKYQLLSLNWQFFLFVQQSAIIKIQFLWLQHCTSSKLTWVYMAGLSQAGGGARGACAYPVFGRPVNPIPTSRGTLSPPSTTCPPGFSDLATALWIDVGALGLHILVLILQLNINELYKVPF
jgi:hypothetical protein